MVSKKILIVYYSRTGTTKKVAEYLRTMFSCDIEEVLDSKIRKGIIALFIGIKDAILRNKTAIKEAAFSPEEYDIIIIGSPAWASHVVPAIRTYIGKYRESFKKVAFFCTQPVNAGRGNKVFSDMEHLCEKKPLGQLKISVKDLESKEVKEKLGIFKAEIINLN